MAGKSSSRRPVRSLPGKSAAAGWFAAKSQGASAAPSEVSLRWLLGALALSLLLAALCGYGALCLLFYQGQWQMVFHPSRTITTTPGSAGLAYDDIHFDVDETGIPRLDGWWIPTGSQTPHAGDTILYLHDGRGSLSDFVPALSALHALGVNLFAFDYRGFGRSAGRHPSERMADQDAIAAWTYLTDTRHLSPLHIVVFGDGNGVTFAAMLAAHFTPAGVVLEDPNEAARTVFASDARARILPLFLLQKETLDPKADLERAHVPRLFLDRSGDSRRTRELFDVSSDPKQYFDLRASSASAVDATLRRFLDEVFY